VLSGTLRTGVACTPEHVAELWLRDHHREAHRGSGAVRIKNPRQKPLNRGERRGSPTAASGSLAQEGRRPGGSVLPQRTGVACRPEHVQGGNWLNSRDGPSQLGIREDEKRHAGTRGKTR
jgi:hypothetical protein